MFSAYLELLAKVRALLIAHLVAYTLPFEGTANKLGATVTERSQLN